jgi:hypothetical protein
LTIFSFSFFFFYIHNTKYKFKTNKQKLHENYNKSPKTIWNLQGTTSAPPEQCQADFQSGKTVAARLLHAPPSLAARGLTRRRKKNQQQGEIRNSFLPSSFLAGGDLQNNQKTQPAVLFSPDLFSDFFFLF